MTGKVVNGPIMFFFVFLLRLFPSSETSSSDCSKSDCVGRYALLSVDVAALMHGHVGSLARLGRGTLSLEIAFLGCVIIRFVVVAVVVPVLTLLRGDNVRLSRVLTQIEGSALREVDDGVQRRPSTLLTSLRCHAWILAFRVRNVSDERLLGELSGRRGRARRGRAVSRRRGIEASDARGLGLLFVLDRSAPGDDRARAGSPRVFGVECHGGLMDRIGSLDGRSLYGPLCQVGIGGGSDRGAGAYVRQVDGGDGDVV